MHGEVVRSIKSGHAVVTETRYAAGSHIARHLHDLPYVSVVLGGHYTEVQDSETRCCSPATVLFHPAGECHADHFHRAAACLNIELERPLSAALETHGFPTRERFVMNSSSAAPLRSLGDRGEGFDLTAISAMLMLAVPENLRSRDRMPRWMRDALASIRKDVRVTTGALAVAAGVHPTYLAQAFVKYVGATPRTLRGQTPFPGRRPKPSASSAPLADIAADCGFADQSHLAREFRRFAAMTPAEYRRHFGENAHLGNFKTFRSLPL